MPCIDGICVYGVARNLSHTYHICRVFRDLLVWLCQSLLCRNCKGGSFCVCACVHAHMQVHACGWVLVQACAQVQYLSRTVGIWVMGFHFKPRPDKEGAGPGAPVYSLGPSGLSRLVTFQLSYT